MRLNSFKRCLMNLIDNGLSYGEIVEVITKKTINLEEKRFGLYNDKSRFFIRAYK